MSSRKFRTQGTFKASPISEANTAAAATLEPAPLAEQDASQWHAATVHKSPQGAHPSRVPHRLPTSPYRQAQARRPAF